MNWKRFYFQGQDDPSPKKVWAEVDEAGELVVEDGLVKIKFQKSEDAKIYTAGLNKISEIEAGRNGSADSGPELDPEPPDVSREVPVSIELPDPPEAIDVLVYTDGATSAPGNRGTGPTGIGVVFWDGSNFKEISQYIGRTTNQVAELQAINVALKNLNSTDRVVRLRTDSQYARKALTEWIHGWRKNGWVNSSGDPVANQRLIKPISSQLEKFDDLEIEWVEGHSGEPLNERADELAVRAVERNK